MFRLRLVAALAVVSLLAGAPGALAQERISIATGGTGGVYFPYGGALANLISEHVEGYEATAEVTSASVDNMTFIENGDAELAFVLGDTAYDALQGNDPFPEPIPARAVATLYNNFTHVVTTEASGIETLADLRDKRVSTGSAGSGTEVIANRLLEAAGLNPDEDIEREQLGAAESTTAIRDGNIDAYFWSGGLPTAAVSDLASSPNLALKLIPNGEFAEDLQSTYGAFYTTDTIPAETYDGQTEAVEVIVVPNVLVASESLDEALVHDILAAMFEHRDDLVAAHPEAENLLLETAAQNSPIPYHPGAVRYFEEQAIPVDDASPVATPAA